MSDKQFFAKSQVDQVSYWVGRLLVAIGSGKFREEAWQMIDMYSQHAYDEGRKSHGPG